MSYTILTTSEYKRRVNKLVKRDKRLKQKYIEITELISEAPYSQSLSTHKIHSSVYEKVWSSIVTGDIRILWNFFGPQKVIILLLTTGGHSGGYKVYR